MGTIERRGKSSWRIGVQVKVAGEWQWVRFPLHLDPALSEDAQYRICKRELRALEKRLEMEVADVCTLREWSETWMSQHLAPDASPVTVYGYRWLLDSRILPQLGDKLITELTPAILTEWLYNLRRETRKTTRMPEEQLSRPRTDREKAKLAKSQVAGKPLSQKTILLYYGCLKTMLAAAVRVGLLEFNPMDRVPRPKKPRQKVTAMTREDAVAILSLVLTDAAQPLRLAVMLALLCSLRLGEVGALRYRSVDWDRGTITVDRALKYTPAEGSFVAETKTAAGDRVITMPPSMLRILREAMWDDIAEAQDDPEKWRGDAWIVHSRHGARVSKDTPSKWFRAFADAHGFQGVTFHDLRHAHASILVSSNLDIAAIAARMGHSDPTVTLSVYTHALPPRDLDAAAAMDQLLVLAGAPPAPQLPADPAAADTDPVSPTSPTREPLQNKA